MCEVSVKVFQRMSVSPVENRRRILIHYHVKLCGTFKANLYVFE